MNSVDIKLGDMIRELRHARGLTQNEVSERVGISSYYLSKVENNRLKIGQFPREDTLQAVAKVLRTDADMLCFLANRIPEWMTERILSEPALFKTIAGMADDEIENLIRLVEEGKGSSTTV